MTHCKPWVQNYDCGPLDKPWFYIGFFLVVKLQLRFGRDTSVFRGLVDGTGTVQRFLITIYVCFLWWFILHILCI